jgi:RecA-family ATPase
MDNSKKVNLEELLKWVDPRQLDYQGWTDVGMALKHEGYPCSVWDDWSKRDGGRYHKGECAEKWRSFRGAISPVTGATITQMAKEAGWTSSRDDKALDWDSEISIDPPRELVDPAWVESQDVVEPGPEWDPVADLINYLEAVFDPSEKVGYVMQSASRSENDPALQPAGWGAYDRPAGVLIDKLRRCHGDIASVLGDYNPAAGAWIRFNPLDGKGVRNNNVTSFRFALIECDNMELSKQNAMIREMELPVAALVYSGGKSIHAIVHIDAGSYPEYQQRVNEMYEICKKNGLQLDTQNKNPSRLSRMPGLLRNGHKQFLLATNIGQKDFGTWKEWVADSTDNLPDPESLAEDWDNMPDLAPALISGVLRQGHKMLLAGPSKAGKSFALIELCIAIAEGRKWIGFDCAQGKVLYVNLELDRASCLHRFKDVYAAFNLIPANLQNIDIWNLRGKSVPMDKLAPKLIRRASKKNYIAVVIDPIYKVITGDENSADQMAQFCNQFDRVCTELGCAVIYCHHHSKGIQGNKRSMDRASGSGVFARDPDALLDLIELDAQDMIGRTDIPEMVKATKEGATAWRIEGTLREFPKFPPVNLWFRYPVHDLDNSGSLVMAATVDSKSPWEKGGDKKKAQKKRKESQLGTAFDAVQKDGRAELKDLAEYLDVTSRTIRFYVKDNNEFKIHKNGVIKNEKPVQETLVK